MKKPWVRKLLIGVGIFCGVILIANFGLNIWLKTQLPGYIKKNTDYQISYKKLSVDLGTGNIFATQISVNSKNPQNTAVIGLQGTIDTLKISRFGIYDALLNKVISSSDVLLAKPNLNIILAKPKDENSGKKQNPVNFENIIIHNGKISVFRYTKQKFLSVYDLDLVVENLQLNEESAESQLPVIFDRYSIKAQNLFVQPDDVYSLNIKHILTENGQMSVQDFQMKPLVSFGIFKAKNPKKPQMYEFAIEKMSFKNIVLEKNKISLDNAVFQNPFLQISTTDAIPDKLKKPFGFEINLNEINLNNAKILIKKPDGNKLLDAKTLNARISGFKFDNDISKEMIPVRYRDFSISGNDLHFYNHQDIGIGSFVLNPKKGDIRKVSVVPLTENSSKTTMNLTAEQIFFAINKWEITDKKLDLDVQTVLMNQINGTVTAGTEKSEKKQDFSGILFPLNVRNIALKNSNLTYSANNQPLKLDNLNANLKNIELTENKKTGGLAIGIKDYRVTTKSFVYRTEFYNMSGNALDVTQNKMGFSNFVMKPLVTRSEFIRRIPAEKDLYDIKVNQISAAGNWDLFSENKSIIASDVTINGANANIFRSKVPEDDLKEKPLYSKMLRDIKIPMLISQLHLKNSVLEYEEDTPQSSGPGKLTFTNFNMLVKNLNSAKLKNMPTKVDIKIDCTFMKSSPLSVTWGFDTADRSDRFSIGGKLTNIPAVALNAFVVPYLSVTATGTIQEMLFNFKGNPKGIGGPFSIKHKDLKVSVLQKETKKKKGILSAVANIFIKSDSKKFPEAVVVEDVERDPTKSFFNLFWKGLEDGLKKTLIGITLEPTRKVPKAAAKVSK